jgi:hypothetical protein
VVLDPSGAAVAGARVVLHPLQQSAPIKTETDGTGSFYFDRVLGGKYDIEVRADGFRDVHL